MRRPLRAAQLARRRHPSPGRERVPALGTGVGRVPLSLAAQLTLEAVRTFAGLGRTSVTDVVIVLDSEQALAAWSEVLTSL